MSEAEVWSYVGVSDDDWISMVVAWLLLLVVCDQVFGASDDTGDFPPMLTPWLPASDCIETAPDMVAVPMVGSEFGESVDVFVPVVLSWPLLVVVNGLVVGGAE